MFLRMIAIGIVVILFGVLGTLGFVNTKKAADLSKEVVLVKKELKEHEGELHKLREEFEALEKKSHGGAHAGPVHWGYEGEFGPENWGKHFATCGSGKSQSPVDLTGPFEKASLAIKPEYKAGALKIVNNGHTVQVNVPPGSTLKVGDESYDLLQFHFHRPSEEKIDGKPMAMVVHLVHKSASGKLAVVGVLMRESAQLNRTLWSIWKHMPKEAGPEQVVSGVSINPANLLPESLAHYSYEGSLTTPPCTEGVRFFIMKNPIGVQREMVDSFPFKMNARPVQPLNGRKISAS
ncbi:carbonic anhydrase [Ramlibacter sp. MAHUQ-53]|uniref:carbonic anhydrase n=1 Tax=unclassified Ramlibacter TaxID=2617605 RepID=UPI003635F9A9